VRDAQRNLARARTLDTEARAQVFTTAAARAFSTGDRRPHRAAHAAKLRLPFREYEPGTFVQ
jgi:hypothetical protein